MKIIFCRMIDFNDRNYAYIDDLFTKLFDAYTLENRILPKIFYDEKANICFYKDYFTGICVYFKFIDNKHLIIDNSKTIESIEQKLNELKNTGGNDFSNYSKLQEAINLLSNYELPPIPIRAIGEYVNIVELCKDYLKSNTDNAELYVTKFMTLNKAGTLFYNRLKQNSRLYVDNIAYLFEFEGTMTCFGEESKGVIFLESCDSISPFVTHIISFIDKDGKETKLGYYGTGFDNDITSYMYVILGLIICPFPFFEFDLGSRHFKLKTIPNSDIECSNYGFI